MREKTIVELQFRMGWLSFGLNVSSFKFTGPDGNEYRWALGPTGMRCPRVSPLVVSQVLPTLNAIRGLKLVTMDGKKTEIAKFHRARRFPKSKRRKARLEVQPAGMGMLDHIILTFVLAEQIRRKRKRRAQSGG